MKKVNQKSLFVRLPEKRNPLSKNEIFKGLSSKDLKDKETSLNNLIVNILNDPYFDQLIMSVLNYILPYQHKSAKLKKLLLIYWEIVQKTKHDGKILDEFMMVCNNLRNDLMHPNEYVVGMSLQLISRIAMRDILDSLLPPIYDKCLTHIEAFVRRNAIACLFSLYARFGKNLLHDLDEKMMEILKIETDVNVKRNAIVLLFKANSEQAIAFLVEQIEEETIDDFGGDTSQLAIVKYLFELCDEDPVRKGMYLKIIFEFMESKFSAVLFEISNQLINYTNNQNALGRSVVQLLKILRENSDTNVKLIILQKLKEILRQCKKLIQNNLSEFFQILDKENTEVQIEALDIILQAIDDKSTFKELIQIFDKILNDLYKENDLNENQVKFHKIILQIFQQIINSTESKEVDENLKEFLFTIVLHNHSNKELIITIKNLIEILFNRPNLFGDEISKIFLNKLLYVQSPEIFKTILTCIVENCSSQEQALQILQKFSAYDESLQKFLRKDMRKNSENAQTKQSVTKTVIQSDGTYATEIVEDQQSKQIFENDDFKTISKALINRPVFAVNFFRNIQQAKQKCDQENKDLKKIISKYCYGLLQVYNYYQKQKVQDRSIFKELNLIFKQLCQQKKSKILKRKHKVIKNEQNESKDSKQEFISSFEDLISFRQLKGKTTVDLEYDEKNIIIKKINSAQYVEKFSKKIKNLVQLTGYSDPIYAEAFVKFNKYNIDLEIFVLNRTDQVLKNLCFNFFSILNGSNQNQNLRLIDKLKNPYLMPEESVLLFKTLQYDAAKEFKIFGEISYQNNAGIIMGYMKTNEISFDILDFLQNQSIETNKFRQLWQICEWENIVSLKIKDKEIDTIINDIQTKLKLFSVNSLNIRASKFNTFCFYSRFILGTDLLLNLSLEKTDNEVVGNVRLRSQNKGVVVLVGNYLRNFNIN